MWVTGYVATLQGNTSAVPALLEQCRTEAALLDDEDADVYATYVQGAAAVFDDDLPLGASLLAEADRRHAELGHMDSNVVMARVALAITVAFGGELDRAAEICAKARAVCARRTVSCGRARSRCTSWRSSRWDAVTIAEARELATSSLRIKEKFDDLLGIAVSVELLALISVVTGSASHAALLLGGADRVWQSVGLPLFGSANFAASHDQCVALCQAGSGGRGLRRALRTGCSR